MTSVEQIALNMFLFWFLFGLFICFKQKGKERISGLYILRISLVWALYFLYERLIINCAYCAWRLDLILIFPFLIFMTFWYFYKALKESGKDKQALNSHHWKNDVTPFEKDILLYIANEHKLRTELEISTQFKYAGRDIAPVINSFKAKNWVSEKADANGLILFAITNQGREFLTSCP